MTKSKPTFGYRPQTAEEFEAEVTPMLGPVIKSNFKGRFVHEFMGAVPKRDWLLKGVFLARTFNLVVGAPGCGKSFLMLDLAMSMALAVVDPTAPKEWFGRKIKPCGVIYIAAEGQDDFIIRMHAWLLAKGLPPTTRLPMFLYPTAIDLRSNDGPAKQLAAEISDVAKVMRTEFKTEPAVSVVDTLNRALAGGDDSKPEHIGAYIRNCNLIGEQTGLATISIHHTAKNSKTQDPRGHSSIRADNDAEIFVTDTQDGAPHTWIVTRAKGAPRGDRHEFRLRQSEVGRDEDQAAVTSCIVAPGAVEASPDTAHMRDASEAARTGRQNVTADGRAILQPNSQKFMRVLADMLKRAEKDFERLPPPPDVRVPHGRVAVKEDALFDELVRSMPGYVEPTETNKADVDKNRDRCRKMRDAALLKLPERGLVGMDKGWVWRTGKRVAGIDRPEHEEITPSRANPNDLGLTEEDVDKLFTSGG